MKIVGMSDLHGNIGFDVPKCDVLIIAGDICPDRIGSMWSRRDPSVINWWLQNEFFPWLNPLVYDGHVGQVVMTWGNHDWTQKLELDPFPDKFHLLVDQEITIDGVRIWGSPWSNEFYGWAWMQEPEDLGKVYAQIPEGIDIIVSHQPPKGYGDPVNNLVGPTEHVGSKELLDTIDRVKPKLVFCGHIHSGHGLYNYKDTDIYNVSVVDEAYRRVYEPTEIILHSKLI